MKVRLGKALRNQVIKPNLQSFYGRNLSLKDSPIANIFLLTILIKGMVLVIFGLL